MRINTDNTARIIVLSLCICIVIMRLLRPEIAFDACSLGALALAALIAIAPTLRGGRADSSPDAPRSCDVDALKARIESAGLLMAESRGAYAALRDTRPVSLALAGAYATLTLRLKSLTDQARLDAHGTGVNNYLSALNAAGVTTGEQHEALSELARLLETGAQCASPAGEALLDIAIGVIEMLDGTLG